MKTASANLLAHLAGETLTVCTLWKITRADATVFGFTDNSRDVVYDGVTYEAATGHTPSTIRTTSNLGVDNLDVHSVLDSSTITDADIDAGLWDFAEVEIMVVNYLALADGHMLLRRGWLGNVKTGRSAFVAELRGMMQPLQQTIGRIYQAGCNAALGDARCGFPIGSAIWTSAVTAASSDRIFTFVFVPVIPDDFFAGGLVTWTGGDNAGYAMEVKSSVRDTTIAAGITSITNAAAAVVTVANSFSNGDVVTFDSVTGMTEINGLSGTVSAASGTDFTVNIDSTAFSAYTGSAGRAVRYDGDVVTLQQPMPNVIAIGDTYTITAGCDKTLATCIAKFGNVINFRGFPHLPGVDKMVAGK